MFRKTSQKQTSVVSPKGKEKQIDYILTKRRYLRKVKDAEGKDMIHMGSDHRCVMATFLIMLGKDIHAKNKKKMHDTIGYAEHEKKKNINIEMSELEIPRNRWHNFKKAAALKRKWSTWHKTEEETPQQQKQTAHLRKPKHKKHEMQQHSSKPTVCSSSVWT